MTTPISPPVNPPTDPKAAAAAPTTIPNSTLDTSIKAINTFAVELDSTPVSPIQRKPDPSAAPLNNSKSKGITPAEEDEEAYEEMTGEKGMAGEVRERRKKLLAERANDPAVLVDIPPTPRAEEYVVAEESKMAGTTGARLKRDEEGR
ncbi:hypothetical protein Vi05172_g161 [Venturia inaequalis]|nr:hypothetical protein Vi05172_g161 [Venturia inaequalis]